MTHRDDDNLGGVLVVACLLGLAVVVVAFVVFVVLTFAGVL